MVSMETKYYLAKFQKAADGLDKQLLNQYKIEYKVGEWLDSVVLKMQKKSWAINSLDDKAFEHSIFFSIWLSDQPIKDNKLYYNIHALKLRSLPGYSIQSREFAAAFRSRFKVAAHDWPNVSLDFGPQTLIEGWIKIDMIRFENDISDLVSKFIEIHGIIDGLLEERRK